jgi:1-aminocyclopropane-1-carboxylate synthase
MPEYLTEHFARAVDVDPADPGRYIGLAIAENKLVWDLLEPKINTNRNVPEFAAGYDTMVGSERFRSIVAGFGSRHLWRRTVGADEVVTLAGGGSILETLFYVIGDPGDGVVLPTPSYAGFWMDIETRDQMRVVPAHMSPDDDFRLDADVLDRAYQEADVPIKALLLTNPSNPTGRILTNDEIRDAVAWARSVEIHVVINEIYALSAHGDTPVVPASILIDDVGDDLHFVWAVSKDFAMSGFRCGVMTTTNTDVRAAMAELAYWSIVSGDTQHLLGSMLADEDWVSSYLAEMRSRLGRSYAATTGALERAGIPYIAGHAGLFLLLDMRGFLAEPTWDAEGALWRTILEGANVNLTPGAACRVGVPGFLRVCFAQEPPEVVERAIERIGSVARHLRR